MTHITPHDVVPALRNNLAFSHLPHGLGTGFVNVKNVENGDEFRLRGFEYSLARMLDGHRTAAEVVAAARRVGLPVTIGDLEAFVHVMTARKLLAPIAAPPAEDDLPSFASRERWDEKTRKLFQFALREGRTGNLNRALVSLDCLLHERPNLPDAMDLRELLEERQQDPSSTAPFRAEFDEAERDWLQAQPTAAETTAGRRRIKMILAGACFALAALAIAASLVPFPHQVKKQATLFPIASAHVAAPRSGTIAAVPVAVGQWVEKDAVLYTYDVTQEMSQIEEAVARLEELNRGLYANLPQTQTVREARVRYGLAEARLAVAQSNLEKERVRDGDQLIEAEESLNWALREITEARQALDAMVPSELRAALRSQQTHVQALEMKLLESEVKAPISGAITKLEVQPGSDVVKGFGAAQIDDSRQLKAISVVEPRDRKGLAAGQPVLLLSNGRATNTKIDRTSGGTVEMVVDNPAMTFEPGQAQVQIRGNPVPLIR